MFAALAAIGSAACSHSPGNGAAHPTTAVPSEAIACTPTAITKGLRAHGELKIPRSKLQSYACKDDWANAAISAPSIHPPLYAILRRTTSGWSSERAVDAVCFSPGSCPGYVLPPPAVLRALVQKIGPLLSGAA
jgi:hypothetical protein